MKMVKNLKVICTEARYTNVKPASWRRKPKFVYLYVT